MAAASVFRTHAAHFIVFGLPVVALVATVGGQELRARMRARDGRAHEPRASEPCALDATREAERALDRGSVGLWVATGGLAVSALVHASVIREHFHEYVLFGVFFTLLFLAQGAIAVLIAFRPARATVRAVALASAWVVVLWLVSRTTGLPFGPEVWEPERYGALDAVASAAELLTVIGCLAALYPHALPRRRVGRHAAASS
jgi:hypothetical protein